MLLHLTLPLSIAASWAWGTSLIVGMQIAQEKGFIAWLIWATANCLTLVLFGELTRRGFLTRSVFEHRVVKWMALAVQIFCLVVNLNILNEIAIRLGASPMTAYIFATVVGLIFILWMYPHGLSTSIFTDKYQALLTGASLAAIVALGLCSDTPRVTHAESSLSDVMWGCWSACILFSGPIGDIMHYQRADRAGHTKAYAMAGGLFAIYLTLVLMCSFFTFTPWMNMLLLVAVICVTTSTIDSIAVALHEMVNKTVGTIAACLVCVLWGVFADIGIIVLWSNAGVFRVLFALTIIYLAYRAYRLHCK